MARSTWSWSDYRRVYGDGQPASRPEAPEPAPASRDEVQAIEGGPDRSPVSWHMAGRLHCRWPLWEGDDEPKLVCGARRVPGSSYCHTHLRVSMARPQRRNAAERDGARMARIAAAGRSSRRGDLVRDGL